MLINHLVRAGLSGAVGGIIFVVALVVGDAFGIGSMIIKSHLGGVALAVLTVGVVLTFAALAMGVSVMTLAWDWDGLEDADHGQKGDSDRPM
jgi:hypothetical protein